MGNNNIRDTQNSGRTANLRPFKKGQSGNPGGRPKTAHFSEQVRKFLAEKHIKESRLREVLESLQKDDPKILLHYAFGKPLESLDLNTTSTVVGLPDDILAGLREYAKTL